MLQRYDKLNEDQVRNGINGYTFDSAKEMADVLRMLKAKTPEEFVELKQSVINSVKKSGAESLANSLLEIYKNYEHHIKRVDK